MEKIKNSSLSGEHRSEYPRGCTPGVIHFDDSPFIGGIPKGEAFVIRGGDSPVQHLYADDFQYVKPIHVPDTSENVLFHEISDTNSFPVITIESQYPGEWENEPVRIDYPLTIHGRKDTQRSYGKRSGNKGLKKKRKSQRLARKITRRKS